jgi:threonine dehydrogenase-like Zn-dependent dehydrogenase
MYDRAAQTVKLVSDRASVLRQAIFCCKKGGVVSLAGVYGGLVDKVPVGAAFNKGLTFKMGQTHVHRSAIASVWKRLPTATTSFSTSRTTA